MRLPYLQLDADLITTNAVAVAHMLKVSKNEVVGMAAALFAYALTNTETDDKPPDGVFIFPEAGTLLEAVMGWAGEPGKAIGALALAGVVEKLEIGWRVRGTDRYAQAWAKQKSRSEKATKAANKRWSDAPAMLGACSSNAQPMLGDARGMLGDAKTQTQTQTQTQKEDVEKANGDIAPEIAFFTWADEQRRRKYPNALPDPTPVGFVGWYRGALKTAGGDPPLRAAWLHWLEDTWAQSRKTPCPMAAFIGDRVWFQHVPGQSEGKRVSADKARVA